MKKRTRAISFLLILSLVFGLMPTPFASDRVIEVQAATASEVLSGTCGANGANITWKLTVDTDADWDLTNSTPYKLTLTGSGEMADYSNYYTNLPPWHDYRGRITSISIAEGITTIGDCAFYEFASLKTFTLPNSVTYVGFRAVSYCSLLKTIVCGTGLKTTGNGSFSGNRSLTDVQLNNGLEEIGYSTFYCCDSPNLKEIIIPDSVTTLRAESFYSTKIRSITIPKNVTTIEDGTFWNCDYLENIQVAAENPSFFVQDNVLLYEKKEGTPYRAVAYAVNSDAKTVSIADGTEIIGEHAFAGAQNLTSVAFPDTLKTIDHSAFWGCTGITELNIPDSVETIGVHTFGRCLSLTTLNIGKGLKQFVRLSFERCTALNTITISEENPYLDAVENVIYNKEHTILYLYAAAKPETVYHILDTVDTLYEACITNTSFLKELYIPGGITGAYLDAVSNNQALNSIYFLGDAPTNSGFMHSNAGNLILYRRPSTSGWDAAGWKNFLLADWDPDNPTLEEGSLDGVSWRYEGAIGRISFTGPGTIPDFTLENPAPWNDYMAYVQTIEAEGITDIGNYSFYNAVKLLRLEADEDLSRVGDYAFANCSKQVFTDITTIDTIGISAFQSNNALRGGLILEKVSSIGSSAFQGCATLQDAIIGARLTTLEENVFAGCTALNRFIIPESVSMIKTGAFQGCSSLRTINIPAGVNAIGSQSFSDDSALEKVYFYGKIPTSWADDSFESCNSGLTLYYRKTETDWNQLGASWNGLPLTGLERFYTERQDHYSFSNSSSSFGYPYKYRIPRQRYVDVLDDIIDGTYWYVVDGEWRGSCYGMTASTLEFYENPKFSVTDYATSAENLYAVAAPRDKNSELTKLIEAYQISQYATSVCKYNGDISAHMRDYKGLIQKVEEFERSGGLGIDSEAEPVVMLIYSIFGGHAVIPVSVTQIENGDFQLKVYDPNYPSALRTLTIYKDFSRISYGIYTYASYANYNTIAKDMSGVHLYSDARDTSLYLSIDKEKGKVTNTDGMGIDEIEGAYESKPLSAENEDTFSGIKRFVLPKGDYQLTAKEEEKAETTKGDEDSVTFYLASEENFAKIDSSDEDAVLEVREVDVQNDGLEIELQSESKAEETTSFTIMNRQGMERTVEVEGANATLQVAEDDTITIQAPAGETVSIDGKEIALHNGQAVSSFVAAAGENPLKVEDLQTSVDCDGNNKLNGTVSATVISNTSSAKKATVTADYYEDQSGKKVASYSEEMQLDAGMNMITLSFEEVETAFSKTEGETSMTCKLTVLDENSNSVTGTMEDIVANLAKKTGTTNPGDNGVAVTKVTVTRQKVSLSVGESVQLNASVIPATAWDKTLTYKASNDNVTVTQNGKVTAEKAGYSEITISSSNGKSAVVAVTVTEKTSPTDPGNKEAAVTKVTVTPEKLTLSVGESAQLNASVLPADALDKTLTYKVSNDNVTVTQEGVVTAKKAGSSQITVSSSNGKSAVVTVTVTEKKNPTDPGNEAIAVAGVSVTPKEGTFGIGESFRLEASVTPKDATDKTLTFVASNDNVTVTQEGVVTARKAGSSRITVSSSNGKYAVADVVVKKAPDKITLNVQKQELKVGKTFQIEVKLPQDTASNHISYSSSKKSVAKVSASGKVTAMKKGTATITVKTFNGKTAKLKIMVTENTAVKKLTAAKKKLTLGVGESAELKVSVSPKDASNQGLSYKASNSKVKVTSKGKVTARKTGSSKITVKSSNGKKVTINVTVKKAPDKIMLNAQKKTLKAGKTFQVKVKFPQNTASNKITYSSAKKSVADISASGKITAKKKGKTTITVKTFNGKKAKLNIIVK